MRKISRSPITERGQGEIELAGMKIIATWRMDAEQEWHNGIAGHKLNRQWRIDFDALDEAKAATLHRASKDCFTLRVDGHTHENIYLHKLTVDVETADIVGVLLADWPEHGQRG